MGTYLIYKYVYPNPRDWYNHFYYLAKSFLKFRLDIANLPDYFQDSVSYRGKTFLPFPPTPAVVLIPFMLLIKNVTQQQISILVGSLNIALIYILLKKLSNKKNALFISLFTAFGTVYFWAAVVGTTWYFAHIVAVFFFVLSLLSFFKKRDVLAGVFFSLAVCARLPIFMGVVFFILESYKNKILRGLKIRGFTPKRELYTGSIHPSNKFDGLLESFNKKRLFRFLSTAFICVPILLGYNFLRFGNIFKTGYLKVYETYIHSNYPFTILQLIKPEVGYFGYLDPKNIPLHLFTFLIMPPVISASKQLTLTPSPYGMGILFVSPLLLAALKPNFKDKLQKNLFLGALAISLIDFMHYMQGWVQFGYRFSLDFLPFLLIILALRFKPNKKYFFLLLISILVNFWGVNQAIALGW